MGSSKKIPPSYAHQKKSVAFCKNHPEQIIFDTSDPGTGKTKVQIDVIDALSKHGKTLVIAPKSLLSAVWANDIRKFAPHLRVSLAPAGKRDKAFAVDADVYVINTDGVTWLVKQPKKFFKDFHALIIDEVADFKHRTSNRSKALLKISKYFKYRAGMTGTPNTNSVTELWHQAKILDGGERLGKSFIQFRNAVCTPTQVGPQPNMLKWTDKESAPEVVASLLADITIRNVFEECVDIPAQAQHTTPYKLPPQQRKIYEEVKLHTLTELNNGVIISAINGAALMTKLLQIASGAVYSEADTGHSVSHKTANNALGYALIDEGRYMLIADLVAAREHSVVFFNWNHQRHMLEKEFKKRGITYAVIAGNVSDKDRVEAVEDYDKGMYDVMLAHPQSAAHGLTLVKGRTVIWASPTPNLQFFIQGNRRIYRIGQKFKTEVLLVMAEDTIEQHVFQMLIDKDEKQSKTLDLLRGYYQNI